MQDTPQRKTTMRRAMSAARDAMNEDERARASASISTRVVDLPRFRSARRVALFAAIGSEVDVRGIEAAAISAGRETCYPRVMKSTGGASAEIAFFVARRDELVPGAMKIPEPVPAASRVAPTSIDFFVVPGLAFDAAHRRLGYGKGFYDRVLAAAPAAAKVGVAFDLQLVDEVPATAADVTLDLVVTESRVL